MYIPHFIHLSFDGHLGLFHMLAVMNKCVMNTEVQVSLQDIDFNSFGYIYPEIKSLIHMLVLFLIF